ncbi:MAG TPA: ATP-binding protein [Candidatus Deferrimicrobium sp.]|nr:ATP-binding protein [Candidatus Deferrimicrobium sp.]
MDDSKRVVYESSAMSEELSKFTESYASFRRIINSLQRKYLELQDEFTAQNAELADANAKLVALSEQNLAVSGFLDRILNSISAGVVAVDQTGRITHFNRAASDILGLPAADAAGRLYREVLRPGNPVDANALRSAETGREIISVEKSLQRSDGCHLSLSVSTAVLKDDNGTSIGAVEVFHDLTKIKRMEQEIARLNTLAALGEMAATIAHEVRNPLSGIIGFASLLEKELAPDDPKRKHATNIVRGVNTINDIVTTLLNYARVEELNRAEVNLEGFLEAVVEQYRQDLAEKAPDVEIVFRSARSSAREKGNVFIDRLLMRQVLFNVMNNSVDALSQGGKIDIHVRQMPRPIAAAEYKDRILLGLEETLMETVITDDGPGFAPENLDRVFAPFFTTRKEGSGLGLAMAWKVVKAHGGEIQAGNSPEGGAIIRILLPAKLTGNETERST